MVPGVEAPMTKRPLSSRIPISPGILLVSTINSGLTRPDRSCTSRSVPPASTLAAPEAPARILTASSTLVGAAKLRLGMFAPEFARARFREPRGKRHHATLAYTTIPCVVKNYVRMPLPCRTLHWNAVGAHVRLSVSRPSARGERVCVMDDWMETWRGIVAPWECDITEHFTIAYYFDRLG